jgi:orotidine-5'-phosphate decarboxylase
VPSDLFADRLAAAVACKESPVVVGLDPHPGLFPPALRDAATSRDRVAAAAAVEAFCAELLEAVADLVAIVKPQIAFFERLGPPGWSALEATVARAQKLQLLVLADAKRGDIGSTADAYAQYFFGAAEEGFLGADALTVSPYLGADSLAPFVAQTANGKGLFVLAKTSNPGSTELQDLVTERDDTSEPVWSRVGQMVERLGADTVGSCGYSSFGLVVGATSPAEAGRLRATFPRLPFLVPGYGAQGAGATEVVPAFDEAGTGAIVNASRSILFAYRQPQHSDLGVERWAEASRRECISMRDAIRAALDERRSLAPAAH